VGGGIRSVEQARELLSLGAERIIVGSPAFRRPDGSFGVNDPFLEAMSKAIGREHLILAVDAGRIASGGGYEVLVDGWKTPTGLGLIEAAQGVEPYAGELLFTGVDREGTLEGIDMEPVRALRGAVSCRITAAGGISSIGEIEALAALDCDAQLGMALYTGKIGLAEAFIRSLNWKKIADTGLIPLIVQSPDSQVLMTGYADEEALRESFDRGNLCFHSRTKGRLWMKGESSGNTLKLLRLRADCDRDALLATVENAGPVCHTGAWSCFSTERRYTWELLQAIVAGRLADPQPASYTAALDDGLVREKVLEEAEELCRAGGREEVIWEAADLLYFATVLMTRSGVAVAEVLAELDRRHKK
jgi:phosphoribosyl-ATP pyrophosphohydrolase/phosphoribosyl-AMP cyclohydrolase